MLDIGGFAICGLIKSKERQLTIQKRDSSSIRVVAARQTEEGHIAGERRSSSLLREYRGEAARQSEEKQLAGVRRSSSPE